MCEVLPPDRDGFLAVVAFTGHAYVLADVDAAELAAHGADGYGGASKPPVLQWLARAGGQVGSLDAVLVTEGVPGPALPRRSDLDDHPRVAARPAIAPTSPSTATRSASSFWAGDSPAGASSRSSCSTSARPARATGAG